MGVLSDYYTQRAITSPFGDGRANGRTHRGVDFSHSSRAGEVGVPAMRAGRVVGKTVPSNNHGFGHSIIVRSVLDDGNEWDIRYAHGPWASGQQVGEWVEEGQIILHEGTTGWTDGSCVHIEQQRVRDGHFTDPAPEALKSGARQDATAPASSGFQATPRANVNGRDEPNTGARIDSVLKAGTVGNFSERVNGESVEGNNVWFKGAITGKYFWSGAF